MKNPKEVSPLTLERAIATIGVVAQAVQAGEQPISYSELARRLGMSKVNGQGLSSYLNLAATLCANHGLPNVAVFVVSKDSLDSGGAPMPSKGSFADGFYASTGLTKADIPAEQDRVRGFDWSALSSIDFDSAA